jgi:hypothetical protein
MYIIGLSSSWGTSRICPAWSPPEHQLAPALSPILGPHPKPHCPEEVVIVLMTAAHISPNVFSLRNFLSNIQGLFLTIHSTSFIYIIHHIHTNNCIFYFHSFGSSWQAGCPRSLVTDTTMVLDVSPNSKYMKHCQFWKSPDPTAYT